MVITTADTIDLCTHLQLASRSHGIDFVCDGGDSILHRFPAVRRWPGRISGRTLRVDAAFGNLVPATAQMDRIRLDDLGSFCMGADHEYLIRSAGDAFFLVERLFSTSHSNQN